MSNDDTRFSQYLTTRAATLELPPGDPSTFTARAHARRRRRRAAGTGLAALALVAGVLGVQQIDGGDDGGAELAAQADAITAADPLQWTTVVPNVGLAWSNSTAVTEDGTSFGLATAPGRYTPDNDAYAKPQTLYRSEDGVEWSPVALPADLWPSHLAASGRDLYAVGTSPAAGGSRSLVIAKSSDGGEWSTTALPTDIAALQARYGTDVRVAGMSVAAGPGGVVAAVELHSEPDITTLVPTDLPVYSYAWTASGLDVYGVPEGCEYVGLYDADCGEAEARPALKEDLAEPPLLASYTFEELGIDEGYRSLIRGELHVFASADGGAFDEVDVPTSAGGMPTVIAADDGFVLLAQRWDATGNTVTALRSDDGRTWSVDATPAITGWAIATGSLRGRPAVVVQSDRSGGVLEIRQSDGTWSTLDLGAAVIDQARPTGSIISVSAADIGPLGVAAVVSAYDETGETQQNYAVHSPDGTSISIQPLTDVAGAPGGYPAAVRVSADAVTIVFGDDNYDDGVPRTTLLVGTPAG